MKKLVTSIALCSIGIVGLGQSTNAPCPGVSADFTSQTEPAAGGIRFTNNSQFTGSGNLTYQWNFGNGQTTAEENPFSVYNEGIYTVSLTVVDPNGCQTVVEKEVEFSYNQ